MLLVRYILESSICIPTTFFSISPQADSRMGKFILMLGSRGNSNRVKQLQGFSCVDAVWLLNGHAFFVYSILKVNNIFRQNSTIIHSTMGTSVKCAHKLYRSCFTADCLSATRSRRKKTLTLYLRLYYDASLLLQCVTGQERTSTILYSTILYSIHTIVCSGCSSLLHTLS